MISSKKVLDPTGLVPLLTHDRVVAAYPLGDLDATYADFCEWWAHEDTAGRPDAAVLLYTGLRSPVLLTVGTADGVDDVLDSMGQSLPQRFFAHVMAEHRPVVDRRAKATHFRPMVRMALQRQRWAPPESAEAIEEVVPVGHQDTADLMALYAFYPDAFFEPYQLESGFYFGIRRNGRLVSVAGTHIVSRAYDIACLGNVVTHPDYRSQGLSRRCTQRLLGELFQHVTLCALNVQKDNARAHAIYRHLGFMDHVEYVEGVVEL